MHMIGFVRLCKNLIYLYDWHTLEGKTVLYVCIYYRVVRLVLESYMSVVAGCSVVLFVTPL